MSISDKNAGTWPKYATRHGDALRLLNGGNEKAGLRARGRRRCAAMEIELSQPMGGGAIDLRTAGHLSRYFRHEVGRAAELQQAR